MSAAFSASVMDDESSFDCCLVSRRPLNGLVCYSTDLPLNRSRLAPFPRWCISAAKMNRELRYFYGSGIPCDLVNRFSGDDVASIVPGHCCICSSEKAWRSDESWY